MDISRNYCQYRSLDCQYPVVRMVTLTYRMDQYHDSRRDTSRHHNTPEIPRCIFHTRRHLGTLRYHVKTDGSRTSRIRQYHHDNSGLYSIPRWCYYDTNDCEKVIVILFQFIFPTSSSHITKYSSGSTRIHWHFSILIRHFIPWIEDINQKYNNIKTFKENTFFS